MKTRLFIISVVVIIASSCSSINITSDSDSTTDFTQFKTYSFYGWADDSEQLLNRFDQKRFEKAFADEFNKRRLTYIAKDGDIVVSLFVVVNKETSRTSYTTHYGTGGYGYYSPWAWGMGHTSTSYHDYDYLVGTLICDVFDASSKQLIWQGVASGEIKEDDKKRDRTIPRTVNFIMQKYPIPPTKR